MKLTINNNEYNLSLSIRAICELEDKIEINPLQVISSWDDEHLPKFKDMVAFLWAMCYDNHHLKYEQAYQLATDYINDGHKIFELIPVVANVLKECGYFGKSEDNNSKN